jgi:hypothetical protein
MTIPANLHGLRYVRGSVAYDLTARPLRTLAEWIETYPHLVITALGGSGDFPAPRKRRSCFADDRLPFWEVLPMPDGFAAPVSSKTVGDSATRTSRRKAQLGALGSGCWCGSEGIDSFV